MSGRVAAAGSVLCANEEEPERSLVEVREPRYNDDELWVWDNQLLKNKATGMVMSIRKGRLRLIEDTQVCLYPAKPLDEYHQQQWGILKEDINVLGKRQAGCFLHSIAHNDWVLDFQMHGLDDATHLILFPHQSIDNDSQRWDIVPASDIHQLPPSPIVTTPFSAFGSPSIDDLSPSTSSTSSQILNQELNGSTEFAHGLSPSKRGSQSSVTGVPLDTYRESHQMVYQNKAPHSSDKTLAMAAAYQTWHEWNQQQHVLFPELQNQRTRHEKTRARLQSMARTEAIKIIDTSLSTVHRDTVVSLTNRFITQLYEKMPLSP
ncbi:hypothetical protein BDF14DRAFT_1729269 [Spinellus fusiger]|nr:hypothetical protein BDF14DRAFT_1729269 [Spinellus fusiger]